MQRHRLLVNHPKLQFPSLWKAAAVCTLISLPFLGAAGALFYFYAVEPEYTNEVKSAAAWRVLKTGTDTTVDWRACSMQFYDSDGCSGAAIELQGKPIASSSVPDGFFDGFTGCGDGVWSSNTSDTAYIGWQFDEKVTIGCISLEPAAMSPCRWNPACMFATCGDDFYCDPCCDQPTEYEPDEVAIQQLIDGKWHTIRTYTPVVESLEVGPDELESNDKKFILLIVAIVVATFGGVFVLIFVPAVLWGTYRQRCNLAALQSAIDADETFQYTCEDLQWKSFVEQHWGPRGRARKALPGPAVLLLTFAFAAGVAFFLVKLRALIFNHSEITWLLDAEVVIPTCFVIVALAAISQRCAVRRRYAKLLRGPQPVVLGPRSMYFDGILVRHNVEFTAFRQGEGSEGLLMVVQYVVSTSRSDKKLKVTVPVPAELINHVKAYVAEHTFYRARLPVRLATQPATVVATVVAAPVSGTPVDGTGSAVAVPVTQGTAVASAGDI